MGSETNEIDVPSFQNNRGSLWEPSWCLKFSGWQLGQVFLAPEWEQGQWNPSLDSLINGHIKADWAISSRVSHSFKLSWHLSLVNPSLLITVDLWNNVLYVKKAVLYVKKAEHCFEISTPIKKDGQLEDIKEGVCWEAMPGKHQVLHQWELAGLCVREWLINY